MSWKSVQHACCSFKPVRVVKKRATTPEPPETVPAAAVLSHNQVPAELLACFVMTQQKLLARFAMTQAAAASTV